MGLRVATLVNLTFVGGDRADEAAARFVGHNARTRAIPDGIRRFGTWAPLLIPFYIPRGARMGQGLDRRRDAGARRHRCRAGAGRWRFAYGSPIAAMVAGRRSWRRRHARKAWAGGPRLAGAPDALGSCRTLPPQQRRGRGRRSGAMVAGAAIVLGASAAAFRDRLFRRPLDPLQARGISSTSVRTAPAPWSIGYCAGAARRAYVGRGDRLQSGLAIVNVVDGVAATMEIGPDPEGAVLGWRIRLADQSGRRAAAPDQLLRNRRPRDRRLRPRSRFRRHACRNHFRARAQRDSRAQSAAALGRAPIEARLVLRGEGRRRGPKLVGYEDLRSRFLGEGSLASPTGCEPRRWRKLDDKASCGRSIRPRVSRSRSSSARAAWRNRVHRRPRRQRGLGAANSSRGASICRRCAGRTGEARLRDAARSSRHRRSPSRWPFRFSPDGEDLRLTHRTPRPWAHVMANERRRRRWSPTMARSIRPSATRAERPDAFRFDSVTTPQPGQIVYIGDLDSGRDRCAGICAVPARRRDASRSSTSPASRPSASARGDLATDICGVRPAGFSRRHAAADAAQSGRDACACASRRSSTSCWRRARTRASASLTTEIAGRAHV